MASANNKRVPWLDTTANVPVIAEQAKRLESFIAAMADDKVDASELADQEARLVAAIKVVEPMLSDEQHSEVTRLLCELTAYDIMHLLHALQESRPKTVFRG
jgi:hypothetical protein